MRQQGRPVGRSEEDDVAWIRFDIHNDSHNCKPLAGLLMLEMPPIPFLLFYEGCFDFHDKCIVKTSDLGVSLGRPSAIFGILWALGLVAILKKLEHSWAILLLSFRLCGKALKPNSYWGGPTLGASLHPSWATLPLAFLATSWGYLRPSWIILVLSLGTRWENTAALINFQDPTRTGTAQ